MAAPWERDWSGAKVMGGTGAAGKPPTGYQPSPNGLAVTPGGPDYLDKVLQTKKAFNADQSVAGYRTQVPILASAARAPKTPAGDLNLIYAMGKILDPGSVVREGEMALVQDSGAFTERMLGSYAKQVQGGAALTPKQRTELIGMLAGRVGASARAYGTQRTDMADTATALNLDPKLIVGAHPGDDLVKAGLANYSGSGLNRGKLGLPYIVKSDRDYARVPTGARYTAADGTIRVKKGN